MRYFSYIKDIKDSLGKEQPAEWILLGLLVLALSLSLWFFIGERMLCSRLEYELMQARKLQEKLQQANQYLRVEKSSRESLDHLAKEAKKLGFVPPREEQIVPVDVR